MIELVSYLILVSTHPQDLTLNEIKHFRNVAKAQYEEIKAKQEKEEKASSSSWFRLVLMLACRN